MKTQIIKNLKVIFTLTLVLILFACEKNDVLNDDQITGSYIGTISTDVSGKSSISATSKPATADISMFGNQIEVHCYGEEFDIRIILDVYHNGDDIMVCLTGDDFENMYGHMYGQDNMMHGNIQHNGSEWMQHLNNEHQEGDEHFGSFDMQHHTFNYTFQMSNGDFHFQGTKK